MKVINTQSIPIKLWLNKIDSGAMAQARNLADFPFAFHHVAIMPDAHKGYGMPIGGVLATRDVVIPNAVGVDIGCGMVAVQTTVRNLQKAVVKQILDKLRQVVPVGFNHHKEAQAVHQMPWISQKLDIVQQEFENARKQLGTLGGGNHFIEIQKGDDGYIWLMVHSGSRNLGYKTAKYYNTLAKKKKKEYKNQIPAAWQLDYFPLHSQEAENYLAEMNYCIDFALANRRLMMERFMDIFAEFCEAPRVDFSTPINIAHNYAAREHHFGKKVVVHRKGATSAKKGEMGIIPGSQGDFSYIVEGKGNPESFKSCSHGAGRKMGRKAARGRLKYSDEVYKLKIRGIVHSLHHKKDLDEASGAYKDIDTVMKNQQNLVKIKVKLTPLGVIKG